MKFINNACNYINDLGKKFKNKIIDIMRKGINKTIYLLSLVENKMFYDGGTNLGYMDLSPKDDLKDIDSYLDALKWGVENRKVYNIAISGPYGSGKSSIIETFIKRNRQYKYLKISLATFIEDSKDKENFENTLEKGILQQLFYQVKHEKIPYSRFRKINNITRWQSFKVLIYLVILACTVSVILKPDMLERIVNRFRELQDIFNSGITIVIWAAFLLISIITSINILRVFLGKFKIKSIKTKDGNVEFGSDINDTVFHKYLDEIIYFFEVTDYNVIYFEDLDRFNNLKIFTHLRELNILINKSESISNNITFVYAIKDDIFYDDRDSISGVKQDIQRKNEGEEEYSLNHKIGARVDKRKDSYKYSENRTKFFDFIIPVIPTISSDNSYENLCNMFDEHNKNMGVKKLSVDKELLRDVSIFIDDMRLLTNIFNEFIMYYSIIKEKDKKNRENDVLNGENTIRNESVDWPDLDSLFAIIVYKNLYPIDFSKLHIQQGMLYSVFSEKNKFVDVKIKEIDTKILEIETSIKILEREVLTNIEEVKLVYITPLKKRNINYIIIGGGYYSVESVFDSTFKNILDTSTNIKAAEQQNWGGSQITKEDLLTIYKEKQNFYDRLIAVSRVENNKIEPAIEKLKKEKEYLLKEKNKIQNTSLEKLIKEKEVEKYLDNKVNNEKLIKRLIKFGYINEFYQDYTSYFYEGKITRSDRDFIQCVLNDVKKPFDYNLSSKAEIFKKLRVHDFENDAILNYSLIDYMMLMRENYGVHLEILFDKLSKLEVLDISFIDYFIYERKSKNTNFLIKNIISRTDDFWEKCRYSNEKKEFYFRCLIEYGEKKDIKNQDKAMALSRYITENDYFIDLITDDFPLDKLNGVIKEIGIKLKNIRCREMDNLKSKKKFLEFIYENKLYEININNVNKISRVMMGEDIAIICESKITDLNSVKVNVETRGCPTYSLIKSSDLDKMIDYFNSKINDYVSNVLLVNENKEIEEADFYIWLLNNKGVNKELITKIIEVKKFSITDLKIIDNKNLFIDLVYNRKVKVTWENLLTYFDELEINGTLSNFINDENVIELLSKDELYNEDFDNERKNNFLVEFLKNDKIENRAISELANKFGSHFDEFNLEGINNERVDMLINKEIITLSPSIYEYLKEQNKDKHLLLIEKNIELYLKDVDSYELEKGAYCKLLRSDTINNESKVEMINSINFNEIANSLELSNSVVKVIKEVDYDMSQNIELLQLLIKTSISKENKCELISRSADKLEKQLVEQLILEIDSSLREKIAPIGGAITIVDNEINRVLVEVLDTKDIISSKSIDEKGIKINRYRS